MLRGVQLESIEIIWESSETECGKALLTHSKRAITPRSQPHGEVCLLVCLQRNLPSTTVLCEVVLSARGQLGGCLAAKAPRADGGMVLLTHISPGRASGPLSGQRSSSQELAAQSASLECLLNYVAELMETNRDETGCLCSRCLSGCLWV